MSVNKILERLDSLISRGDEVRKTYRRSNPDDPYSELQANEALFRQWRTSSLAFLNTLPSEYVYRSEFEGHCRSPVYSDPEEGVAILRAAKEDIEGGYLQKVEMLVSAEVFNDFLEMAEYLLDNGYKDPAASLIGAVLEDSLRRICATKPNIGVNSGDSISSLNQKLAQKQVYNPLQQKQIQVWNDIRNNADHGHFGEYKADDVKDMLSGVQKFLSSYLV